MNTQSPWSAYWPHDWLMYWTHDLHKQFPDERPNGAPISHLRALRGETVSAQLLIAAHRDDAHKWMTASLTADGLDGARLRMVRTVPVRYPCAGAGNADAWYLRKTPGMYPDLLADLQSFWLNGGETRALWLDIRVPDDQPAGDYTVTVQLTDGETTAEAALTVTVLAAQLPAQTLQCTIWFHADCLADYYGVPVFSEEYWAITARFMRALADSGSNMILTPIFTPPLDTEIGGERTTVQLIDVTRRADGSYAFGFDRLRRWIDTATANGLRYFEISHLFTQWGAAAAPKVMAHTPDGDRRIFGWDTPSDGEYLAFLECLLPQLAAQLRAFGVADRCRFHLSDEPSAAHLPHYLALKARIAPLLAGFTMTDALSHYDFYAQGAVQVPVVALNHAQPFLDHDVRPLWVYYCCSQGNCGESNRFIAMPSARNRVLGFQLYLHGAAGFLQWGFNFYNDSHSRHPIDPFADTDADGAFPAGDTFLVYPGAGGVPLGSIRQMVFAEAMQDVRLCEWAAARLGADVVRQMIVAGGVRSFFDYDRAPETLLALRDRLIDAVLAAETA